ncbi:LppM family (lipo)protein [Brachybacterium alimentarium]|uniref:LppM family (lipo)protein n=1 Tax=Brachybacterium alimentarium TaxID=47845 RepID=UPI003FD234C7
MDTITSRRKRIAALVLLPFVLLLAGCGRLSADFEIKDVDTLEISMDLAIESSFLDEMGQSFDSPQAMCDDLTGGMDDEVLSAPVEAYEDGSTWGCRISGVSDRADFGEGLDLTEQDGEYHLTMDLGSEGITQSDLDMMESLYGIDMSDFDFQVSFTFPGKIISSQGGEIDGSTVTYTDLADFSNGVDITAEANGFPWLVVIIVVLVIGFFLLLAIAAVIFFLVRARRQKNNGSGPNGPGAPAAYGAAGAAGAGVAGAGVAGAAASPFGTSPSSAPPATPQGGPQWGPQGSPAAPQGDQQGGAFAAPQWGPQGTPPAAPEAPQWGQAPPPPAAPQDGQQWGQPSPQQPGGDQQNPQDGNQPPQNPGW